MNKLSVFKRYQMKKHQSIYVDFTNNQKDHKNWIRDSSYFIAFFSAIFFLLSFSFNIGYWLFFGTEYMLLMSIYDYIISGTKYLPIILFVMMTPNIIGATFPNNSSRKSTKIKDMLSATLCFIILILIFLLEINDFFSVIIVAIIFLLYFSLRLIKIFKHNGYYIRFTSMFVAFCFLLLHVGYRQAFYEFENIKKNIYKHNVYLKNKKEPYSFIRSIERGVIVLKDEKIYFFPKASIDHIESDVPELETENRACRWFNILCIKKAKEEAKTTPDETKS